MATEFVSRLERAARDVIICWDGGGSLTELEDKLVALQEALEGYTLAEMQEPITKEND